MKILKIILIIAIPFIIGIGFVEYTKVADGNGIKKIVSFHLRLPENACGTTACEKKCLENGFLYEGTRATGTDHFGPKKYQCLCIENNAN
jgi:hypothetical protein